MPELLTNSDRAILRKVRQHQQLGKGLRGFWLDELVKLLNRIAEDDAAADAVEEQPTATVDISRAAEIAGKEGNALLVGLQQLDEYARNVERAQKVMPAEVRHAAIRRGSIVYVGHRHHHCYAVMTECRVPRPVNGHPVDEQGFVDAHGRFLNRHEAYERAVVCGQIETGRVPGTLFSEDLY